MTNLLVTWIKIEFPAGFSSLTSANWIKNKVTEADL